MGEDQFNAIEQSASASELCHDPHPPLVASSIFGQAEVLHAAVFNIDSADLTIDHNCVMSAASLFSFAQQSRDADMTLLRGTLASQLLRNCGDIFQNCEGSAAT